MQGASPPVVHRGLGARGQKPEDRGRALRRLDKWVDRISRRHRTSSFPSSVFCEHLLRRSDFNSTNLINTMLGGYKVPNSRKLIANDSSSALHLSERRSAAVVDGEKTASSEVYGGLTPGWRKESLEMQSKD